VDKAGNMSYVITQSVSNGVKDLEDIDVMLDQETDQYVVTFDSYLEASSYLRQNGMREDCGSFPFNIKIERLQ
tara:strand:- start:278 stop:496 length:219 start_codon:yes stop_codon:yes gene_type:complete